MAFPVLADLKAQHRGQCCSHAPTSHIEGVFVGVSQLLMEETTVNLPSGTQTLDLQSLPCVVGVFDHSLGLFPEEKEQHLALGF